MVPVLMNGMAEKAHSCPTWYVPRTRNTFTLCDLTDAKPLSMLAPNERASWIQVPATVSSLCPIGRMYSKSRARSVYESVEPPPP